MKAYQIAKKKSVNPSNREIAYLSGLTVWEVAQIRKRYMSLQFTVGLGFRSSSILRAVVILGCRSSKDIGRKCNISNQNVTNLANKLVAAKLLEVAKVNNRLRYEATLRGEIIARRN